jgi:solute carrier family 25 phosphate transporter 3
VISQPGDTLLSQINKGEGGPGSATSKLIRLAKEAGPAGLFVGLGPRILMTAGLVSGQFILYKAIKDALGASEGVVIHKATTEE